MPGKGIELCRSLWRYFVGGMRGLGFEQCTSDACVMRLLGAGGVPIVRVRYGHTMCNA